LVQCLRARLERRIAQHLFGQNRHCRHGQQKPEHRGTTAYQGR